MDIILLLALLNASPDGGAVRPTVQTINPWVGRSGKAEALADIAAGRPVKLYYRAVFGEREFVHTPGLSNCNPDRFDVPKKARSRFEYLDADYSESVRYTTEQSARIVSAVRFARAYNITMYTKKRRDVLKICPAATRD